MSVLGSLVYNDKKMKKNSETHHCCIFMWGIITPVGQIFKVEIQICNCSRNYNYLLWVAHDKGWILYMGKVCVYVYAHTLTEEKVWLVQLSLNRTT